VPIRADQLEAYPGRKKARRWVRGTVPGAGAHRTEKSQGAFEPSGKGLFIRASGKLREHKKKKKTHPKQKKKKTRKKTPTKTTPTPQKAGNSWEINEGGSWKHRNPADRFNPGRVEG